jgi:transcription elongation factor B subunit 1
MQRMSGSFDDSKKYSVGSGGYCSNNAEDAADEEQFVKLISAEGHQFIVPRKIALISNTMRAMLEGQFREADQGVINFPDISSHILEKVIEYLLYKVRYNESNSKVPEFKIEPEIALELLVASNYLDC